VAAVVHGRAAFAARRVQAEGLAARRVGDGLACVVDERIRIDLVEAGRGGRDVPAVLHRHRIAALRLDARRPGVTVDIDRAGVGHVDVGAGGEDAVGQVTGVGDDLRAVVDRDVATGGI